MYVNGEPETVIVAERVPVPELGSTVKVTVPVVPVAVVAPESCSHDADEIAVQEQLLNGVVMVSVPVPPFCVKEDELATPE